MQCLILLKYSVPTLKGIEDLEQAKKGVAFCYLERAFILFWAIRFSQILPSPPRSSLTPCS